MSQQVVVYRDVLDIIAADSSGLIIGCSSPDWIAVSALVCSDANALNDCIPQTFSIIGSFGTDLKEKTEGLSCYCKGDGLYWTLNGTRIDILVKDENPYADFVILFTSIERDAISSFSNIRFCRVFDEVVEIGDAKQCRKFLPRKVNPAANLSHPFSFQAMDRVLPIDILVPISPDSSSAPQLIHSTKARRYLDVIVIVKSDVNFSDAFQLLVSRLERMASIPNLQEHHYYSPSNGHVPISIPNNNCPEALPADLHHKVDSAQYLCFIRPWTKGQRLFNVHRFVRPSGLTDNRQHVVSGAYGYYHYLQDGINDDGWGCAYRSLQTLWSWALYQGYVKDQVPDFRKIQEIICENDDKPKSFIGSRQWIGAIEVNCALASIGLLCRILPLNSGAEFSTKGRELAQHFKSHGSPVMIGGGVLAYTLLGIDINDFTGDTRFLILDPHYKGDDDIDVIVKNGWCAWRSADLFDQTAFYNLCMPQKPNLQT